MRVPCLHNPGHDDLTAQLQGQGFVWIDLEGPTDEDLDKLITLHPLTLEDARTFKQRPKIEEYDGYMFMVVFGVYKVMDAVVSTFVPVLSRTPTESPSCRAWRPTTGCISVTSTTR